MVFAPFGLESPIANYLFPETPYFVSIVTVIPQATTCIAIKAMATGQLAPGINEPAYTISGKRLSKRTTRAMVWYIWIGFFANRTTRAKTPTAPETRRRVKPIGVP